MGLLLRKINDTIFKLFLFFFKKKNPNNEAANGFELIIHNLIIISNREDKQLTIEY